MGGNREQTVLAEGEISTPSPILLGTLLCPLVFLLYINDMIGSNMQNLMFVCWRLSVSTRPQVPRMILLLCRLLWLIYSRGRNLNTKRYYCVTTRDSNLLRMNLLACLQEIMSSNSGLKRG